MKVIKGLRKVTVNLVGEDWDALPVLYPSLGPSVALRNILNQHVKTMRARQPRDLEINLTNRELDEVLK